MPKTRIFFVTLTAAAALAAIATIAAVAQQALSFGSEIPGDGAGLFLQTPE
jgi:hypothetical protein